MLLLILSPIFTDNMIFQQGCPVPVYGEASPSENVTVTLQEEQTGIVLFKAKTKADKEGKWKVMLPSLEAGGQSLKLSVSTRKETVSCSNVAVGEVWLCSGQSNMAYEMRRSWQAPPLKGEDMASLELEKPANPAIRVYYCGSREREWKIADSESLAPISAAGYFFAKNLADSLNVPVGIISASSGGSSIDQWLENGILFQRQVLPLAPFSVSGFLWYQGETNCAMKDDKYAEKYKQLTSSWRQTFESPDAPFYSVLLCPHTYSDRKHGFSTVTAEQLPLFWQTQISVADEIDNSEIICISDLVDNLEDIHPSYKWIVGERLARVALAEKYGVQGAHEWSGPRAISKRLVNDDSGSSIIIKFEHCAEGLKARANSVEPHSNAQLKWFEIAGADGIWRPALAKIQGVDEVSVSHPEIQNPVYVRFAWRETAQPNLFNSEGLPAFPFNL